MFYSSRGTGSGCHLAGQCCPLSHESLMFSVPDCLKVIVSDTGLPSVPENKLESSTQRLSSNSSIAPVMEGKWMRKMRCEPKWVKSGLGKSSIDVTLLVQPITKSCRLCLWTMSVLWSLPITCTAAPTISHLDCSKAPFWSYLVLVPYLRPSPHVVAREIKLDIWALWMILQYGDEQVQRLEEKRVTQRKRRGWVGTVLGPPNEHRAVTCCGVTMESQIGPILQCVEGRT